MHSVFLHSDPSICNLFSSYRNCVCITVYIYIYIYMSMFSSNVFRNFCRCVLFKLLSTLFLTLKVLIVTIDAQWEGLGDIGSARYEPALLPPRPTIRVLTYSN